MNLNKKNDTLQLLAILGTIVLVNIVVAFYFFRIDLTADKRYSLGEPTKDLIDRLDDDLEVYVYLSGNLPNKYKKIEKAISDKLGDIENYAETEVYYEFIDPVTEVNDSTKKKYAVYLKNLGIEPIIDTDIKEGSAQSQAVFPVGIVSYKGRKTAINFVDRMIETGNTEAVSFYISQLEFEIANAIKLVEQPERKKIAFTVGHGEPDENFHFDLFKELRKFSDVGTVDLSTIPSLSHPSLKNLELLVIAKPTEPYSESDKYKIDQYIMNGGNVAFFLDPIDLRPDTTEQRQMIGIPRDLNLTDLLFTYGARVNNTMIQDFNSSRVNIVVDNKGSQKLMKYDFYPVIRTYANHISVKNAGPVLAREASTIDSIRADGIKKTPLLFTSPRSRITGGNIVYKFDQLRFGKKEEYYKDGYLPVALLLEGKFSSSFQFKPVPKELKGQKRILKAKKEAKLLVCSDGDLILGFVNPYNKKIYPLGVNPKSGEQYVNKEVFTSIFDYQMDATGINALKAKQIQSRPIDPLVIQNDQRFWQLINVVVPLIILVLIWFVLFIIRKRKNTGYAVN